jgi:uncharacterized damage-inducible protein DinB
MLTYARSTTLAAVGDLTIADLDHLHDSQSNSIGSLLAHVVAVERWCQVLTFEQRLFSPQENGLWSAALSLGAEARISLRDQPIQHYLQELALVRQKSLDGLAVRDDEWLERAVAPGAPVNVHWVWFHVAEEEINHRGQIRWLRVRLPTTLRPITELP